MRVVAVIDGEHHPRVARDALDRLAAEHQLCGVLFAGGEEKVARGVLAEPEAHYGREVVPAGGPPFERLRDLAGETGAEAVIDLSGEPVVDPATRFRLASAALHLGLEYRAPGLRLTPPPTQPLDFDGPSLGVIGTGKRTGKTAVGGHYASLLRERGSDVVLVSMGRGGPPEPQIVRADARPDLEALLEISSAGGHAASDYLEDAVLAGITCVGTRRCGEGPAGEPYETNLIAGVRAALELDPEVLLLEGSGAALPSVEVGRTVCVTNASRAADEALSHLGPYRLLRSDLVVVCGADAAQPGELRELKRALGEWCPGGVVGCALVPEPAAPVSKGTRTAFFTTAPPGRREDIEGSLERHELDVRVFSSNLARRSDLERDLERAAEEECELFLTELKAAAIDLVAAAAARRGVEVVFVRNRPVALDGEPNLDDELLRLFDEAGDEARAGRGQPAAPLASPER